jgi:hypothetical protein
LHESLADVSACLNEKLSRDERVRRLEEVVEAAEILRDNFECERECDCCLNNKAHLGEMAAALARLDALN